ncbi:peptide chain release factor 2 [Candidatus Termititenax persephonae]|uniref:Peptide chain release factor 2 n=1 Tax=Candidatus Termititenax persephonae TaxID=2218525 RepID=A0A388TGT7_9BACT|nr:peptide chain release factor 2 [Candidatus Termititenax persephonae]
MKNKQALLAQVSSLERDYADAQAFYELLADEPDQSAETELSGLLEALRQKIHELDLQLKLSGEHDQANAILSINSGAGGTDAQDWAEMLLRLYLRFAEQRGFSAEVIDYSPGEEAGLKSATVLLSGQYAYGYLKSEKGVHRLVRISPFNANGKRQTSFASVDIVPQLELAETVAIDPADLRIDTFRSSGAGGQHINKTDSAVRITHLPTGIVVQCQNRRSQIQNRDTALQVLQARLLALQKIQHKEKISEIQGEQKDIAWGSQIRSYVLHPYSLVKDHRLQVETANVQKVMNGDIMPFIEAYLLRKER